MTSKQVDYQAMLLELHGSGEADDTAGARPSTRAASVVEAAGVAVASAIQVLDLLSDLGKTVPFISPAFVLLKIIIDLEKKAQDVDSKCTDLLERIIFMLRHLLVLASIEIQPTTKEVIKRIDNALKDSGALLIAYRKQSRVARRLSLSNREKFTSCAQTIASCCQDFLLSLQIHQTVRIDILTRPVPVDATDQAAQTLNETHGDAVRRDRGLVAQFAQQQNLVMDDSVMEQLNASIADSMQKNHARLEGILCNVPSAILDGLKNLIIETSVLDDEPNIICVQCDQEFTTSNLNEPLACSFHRTEYDAQLKRFPCCSAARPCKSGPHRAKHHCEYPYAAFPAYARDIYGTEWASAKDTNLATNQVQEAYVKKVDWVTGIGTVEENIMVVSVGMWWQPVFPYYFNTFTVKELEEVFHSQRSLIFRTSPDENEYALAEWIREPVSGNITGIRLAAKAATSNEPWIVVCPIDMATCTMSGEVSTLSKGGMRSYIPASPYDLPKTVSFGQTIDDTQTRPARTFKTKASPALQAILKSMAEPSLIANQGDKGKNCDYFIGKVSVFNNNPPGSLNPITIASVSASYRLVGDAEYAPVRRFTLVEKGDVLPLTLEPRQSFVFHFQVMVPRTEEDTKLEMIVHDWAFLARHRPLRIKFIVEDVEGEQCSLVLEYIATPPPLEQQAETDIAFFSFDDPIRFQRNFVKVEPIAAGYEWMNAVLKIGYFPVEVRKLELVVYEALKTGKTEVDLEIGQERDNGEWEWRAWALVDISCRRVYAFKIMVCEGKNVPIKRRGTLGYIHCPDYGKIEDTTRPISLATETVQLPPLEPYQMPEYPQDDDFDDLVEATPAPVLPVNGDIPIPQELMNRLNSIEKTMETGLTRIAVALEKLIEVLPGLSINEQRR